MNWESVKLAKRDTRLFWGGQTRNVFFGVLLFWLEKWRLWLMWPLFVWNFCVSFTQWCAMVGLWIQGHTARTESHDSTMQHMIRVQAFILKRSKKRSKKQFGGPKSWGLEPGTSLKCSNLLRIHTWGVENIFQHPWLVDAKASPGDPGWNQSDQPPWIYFQQRADQILRVRAGRRLGIAAEESEVALLDGLVAWGFGREKWGWKYGKYGNGVSGGIRGCMSTILVHNVDDL